MKKVRNSKWLILAVLFLCAIRAYPQGSVVDFMQGGIGDAEKFAKAYLRPLGYGLGATLNSGWFNTARVHNTLGFNVTFTFNTALVPRMDRMFDISQLGLERLQLRDPSVFMSPTIAGRENVRPVVHYSETFPPLTSPVTILEFTTPDGFQVPYVPFPTIRAGIGLPGGLELFGRYIPPLNYGGWNGHMWGVGLKFDLKRLIPIARAVPFWNLSLLGAYSDLYSSMDLDLQRNIYPQTIQGIPVQGGRANYDNQELEVNSDGYTINLIASIDIPLFTAFASVGYASSNTSFGLVGDYPILNVDPVLRTANIVDRENPITLEYLNRGELQLTGGVSFKLAVLHIHAAYTLARYPVATAGIGISFR